MKQVKPGDAIMSLLSFLDHLSCKESCNQLANIQDKKNTQNFQLFSVFVSIRIGPGQCCGSESDGSVINWPLGSGSVILNYRSESRSGTLIFNKIHRNFRKKVNIVQNLII
jgi:hypothetical protein